MALGRTSTPTSIGCGSGPVTTKRFPFGTISFHNLLFNIYICMIFRKLHQQNTCMHHIALMESGLNYAETQQTLTNDLTNLDMYLQRWRLRLNVEKTVSSCFHLTNCMAKHHMEVSCGGNTIPTTSNGKPQVPRGYTR